jgi:Alr-MurF fusion protein
MKVFALQALAAFHRQQFAMPIIGITGSNGKTIVKEWLYQLLQNDFNIVRSPKSYNSQIGVPLSVWQINAAHTLGIFEAGISMKNEMERLEKIIKPTIGIFTKPTVKVLKIRLTK